MTTKEIKIGGRYLAKVSGILTVVRVVDQYEYPVGHPMGWGRMDTRAWRTGWVVRNERTGRTTRVKSPQRFRQEVIG